MSMKKVVLINDTSNESHIGCDTVISNIKSLCSQRDIEIIKTFHRKSLPIDFTKDMDLIIINGEGSCHDYYGRTWLCPLLLSIPPNIKTVLINSVWNNMGQVEGIEKLSIIAFRESNSFNSFKKDYPNIKAIIVPDVVFALELNQNIGCGDSVMHGITETLSKVSDNYFPLQYSKQSKIKIFNTKSVQDYLLWLKSLDLYITGRFHGVCLASLARIPFLAMPSNAQKIEGMLKDMGCEELLIKSVTEIEAKKLIAIEAGDKINTYVLTAKNKINELFDNISNL